MIKYVGAEPAWILILLCIDVEPAHWEVMKQNDDKWCALIKISNHCLFLGFFSKSCCNNMLSSSNIMCLNQRIPNTTQQTTELNCTLW